MFIGVPYSIFDIFYQFILLKIFFDESYIISYLLSLFMSLLGYVLFLYLRDFGRRNGDGWTCDIWVSEKIIL